MKYLLLIICFYPFVTFSQTKEDYQKVMDRFVTFYNNDQTDSICTIFPGRDCFWAKVNPQLDTKKDYGKIVSYKYLGVVKNDPEHVTVFKIVSEKKGIKALSFNLHKGKFGTFRFSTSDDEIKEMLKKAK